MLVLHDTLYATNTAGELHEWIIGGDSLHIVINNGVQAIAKDNLNTLYYIKDNSIFKKRESQVKELPKLQGEIHAMLFDAGNTPVAVTSKGIYINETTYDATGIGYGTYREAIEKYLPIANNYFTDSKGSIWMGYDNGEFGGGITFFNLIDKKYYDYKTFQPEDIAETTGKYYAPKRSRKQQKEAIKKKTRQSEGQAIPYFEIPEATFHQPIKGIAENEKGDFLTSESLMHFYLSGSLTIFEKYEEGCYTRYTLNNLLKFDSQKKDPELIEYLGPVAYNPYNKHFYYYSSEGFFRIERNTAGQYSKEFICNPKIHWNYGMAASVGYRMNVTEFTFTGPDSFVFLTENSIGYYNKGTVSWYK
ncbi:hypothetical protein ACLI1A_00340 [Flavobacterium sp. RHBU_3]|uniref:hypothetical protein n=1 Tax=Flavobacterium sp. RHBU_3 TaxID=3391184 RepID=UPI003985110C